MAGRRHIQDIVAEKMRAQAVQQRLDEQGLGRGTVANDKIMENKNIQGSPLRAMKQKKYTIGHKEFFQVCLATESAGDLILSIGYWFIV